MSQTGPTRELQIAKEVREVQWWADDVAFYLPQKRCFESTLIELADKMDKASEMLRKYVNEPAVIDAETEVEQ